MSHNYHIYPMLYFCITQNLLSRLAPLIWPEVRTCPIITLYALLYLRKFAVIHPVYSLLACFLYRSGAGPAASSINVSHVVRLAVLMCQGSRRLSSSFEVKTTPHLVCRYSYELGEHNHRRSNRAMLFM